MSGGHRGKGAGWYARLQAAKGIEGREYLLPTAYAIHTAASEKSDNTSDHTSFAADAESSSRPFPPPPPLRGRRGSCKAYLHYVSVCIALPLYQSCNRTSLFQSCNRTSHFYRFCTITFATFATFATLAFSIHLLL